MSQTTLKMKSTQKTYLSSEVCEMCNGTEEIIRDSCDHNGEHVQTVWPCECTLEK